jgi:hypothetical protein
MFKVPVLVPEEVGVNTTLMLQVAAAASLVQELVWEKSPEIEMLKICRVWPPLF